MNITKDIIPQLQEIKKSLENKATLIETYKALAGSATLLFFPMDGGEAMLNSIHYLKDYDTNDLKKIYTSKLWDYATLIRPYNKNYAVRYIGANLVVLFAEREAQSVPSLYPYLYGEAVRRGLSPMGAKITNNDKDVIYDIARAIYDTIEAYAIFHLSGDFDALGMYANKHKDEVFAEIRRQIEELFKEPSGEPATSYYEEINLFGDELRLHFFNFLRGIAGDSAAGKCFFTKRHFLKREVDEEGYMVAFSSRYKELINFIFDI